MNFFTPAETTANYSNAGVTKSRLPFGKMFVLAILAGFLIGVPSAVTNIACYDLTNNSVIRLLSGVLFAFGLGTVVLTGAELFTGNTLIIISVLEKKIPIRGMFRNWIGVYAGNFVGSMILSCLLGYFNWESMGEGALADYCMRVAQGKVTMPFQKAFVMGILCNMLVTLGVWLSLQAKSFGGRILGAWIPVMFFVTCGFNHSIADMTYCMLGLYARSSFPEIAANYPALTWGNYILGNMIPVTLGNIVGGCLLGWMMWYCNLRGAKKGS